MQVLLLVSISFKNSLRRLIANLVQGGGLVKAGLKAGESIAIVGGGRLDFLDMMIFSSE